MRGFLRGLFKRRQPELNDSILGKLKYYRDETDSYWEIVEPWISEQDDAALEFLAVPGDESGPFEYGRQFFDKKRGNLSSLWALCEEGLVAAVGTYLPVEKKSKLREVFKLHSLTMDSQDKWDVGFMHRDSSGTVFVEFRVLNGEVASFDVDIEHGNSYFTDHHKLGA